MYTSHCKSNTGQLKKLCTVYLPDAYFLIWQEGTYYMSHSERIYLVHQYGIFHSHHNGTDSFLHHQKAYIPSMYTKSKDNCVDF